MEISKRVYISEILKPEKKRLKHRIQQNKKIPGVYCITLPQWESAILEIYSYGELLSDFYESENMVVVGLAAGKEDALVMLRRMIDDIARCGMMDNVKEYFCGEMT